MFDIRICVGLDHAMSDLIKMWGYMRGMHDTGSWNLAHVLWIATLKEKCDTDLLDKAVDDGDALDHAI